MLQDALALADKGYHVFPCAAGSKLPLTEHGFHDASIDPDVISEWWRQHPDANIGVSAKGLLVVDIDPLDGGGANTWPGPDRAGDIISCPITMTPRGGTHRIFRRPENRNWRCSAGLIAPSVDVRTDGGYVLAPPSRTADGIYQSIEGCEIDVSPEELPEPPGWLCDLLDAVADGRPVAHSAVATDANAIPSGSRNSTLASMAGSLRRMGLSQAEILAAITIANQQRCSPPLPHAEVEKIAWSISRYEPDIVSVARAEDHWGQMVAARQTEQVDTPQAAERVSDPGPFPSSLLHVPGLIDSICEYTDQTSHRRQPELALAAALSLMATITGRKVQDATKTRTNLYVLGVCGSGGGKERARQVNKEILYQSGMQEMIGPEGLASSAGLASAVNEQPTTLLQIDEIGRLLQAVAAAGTQANHLYHIATVLMKLFTSSSSVYKSDAYSDPTKNREIVQPHCCIYGTSTPQSLYTGISSDSVIDGFMSRLIIIESTDHCPEMQQPEQVEVPADIIEQVRLWGQLSPGGNLSTQNPQPIVVPYHDDSAEMIGDFMAHCHEQQRAAKIEAGRALWSRAVEKARKLALIHACSEHGTDPYVSIDAVSWGCTLADYATRRLIWLASEWISENSHEGEKKRILRALRETGGMTRSEMLRRFRGQRARDLDEMLTTLIQSGEIVTDSTPSIGAGRPKTIFRIL